MVISDDIYGELSRVEEGFADALTRQALLNDRCDEMADRLRQALGRSDASAAAEIAAQLDLVEARRARAMALACEASQRLSGLRARLCGA